MKVVVREARLAGSKSDKVESQEWVKYVVSTKISCVGKLVKKVPPEKDIILFSASAFEQHSQ